MKRKQKVKHLESTYCPQTEKTSRGMLNLYTDVLQHKQNTQTPTSDDKGVASYSSSHYFSCVSSKGKTVGAGISTLPKCTPKSLEEKILAHEAKETSSGSEYSCQSTLQKHSCAESQKSQVYAPETSIVLPACSQAAGESSSVSEYFSCVSSPNKKPAVDEDGIQKLPQEYCVPSSEMPLETLTPYQRNCFHYHLANEPCTPEIHRRKERDMKVYYMRVQSKKETAGLRNAQKGLVPLQRKTEVQEMTFPGKIPIETNLPTMSAWELLTDSECECDVEEQEKVGVEEKEEEPDSPAGPPALQRRPRARTPEWLVTPESGYKCMGCCRVFPSRTVLQRHVQHGVEEGFSCRAFHLALAWLNSKSTMKEKTKKRGNKIRKITYGGKMGRGTDTKYPSHK